MMQDAAVDEPIKKALALLRREFPDANLYEVRLEFRQLERSGRLEELQFSWTVQVDNDREWADLLEDAIAKLHKRLAVAAQIPERAERIASILRELPYDGFSRYEVIEAAQRILGRERQA
jgi:hypothetical protein